MRAATEGEVVLRAWAINSELVGVVVGSLVAIRGGEAKADFDAALKRTS